jgi:UDP-glucose 4-epimerase
MKPTVFLTGAAGRIGSRVLRKLLDRGFPVKALVHRRRPEGVSCDGLKFVQGDILDQDSLISAIHGTQVICHLAATFDMFPPAVFEVDNNAVFDNVLRGTYNLLEAARRVPELELVLFASTDAVYGTGPRRYAEPITEQTEPYPMPGRFYALAKLVGESLCSNYGKAYDLPWSVIRINWALEDDELLRVFDYSFWEEALSPEDRARLEPRLGGGRGLLCPVFIDGSPAVDQITDPDDTAEGFVLAIERRRAAAGNIFNIAAASPFRYEDFVEAVARGLGLPFDRAKVRGFEPYAISCEKAERLLGYAARHTMANMIDKALQRKRSKDAAPNTPK